MNKISVAEPVTAPLQCQVITNPLDIEELYAPLLQDESKLRGGPVLSISFPRSAEEVSFLLQNNFRQAIPTTVSGARTGLTGGAVPAPHTHLLSLSRLGGIELIAPPDGGTPSVRVGAGTTLAELNAYLDEHCPDYYFPVDPTETSASLAGMAATNASGARSYRYGSIRSWVQWLRAVLVDGGVIELRRGELSADNGALIIEQAGSERVLKVNAIPKPATKNTLGYCYSPDIDPIDLFIGSEGTLGVITDLELKLAPRPTARLYFLQFFAEEEASLSFVAELRAEKKLETLAIEFFDRRSLDLVRGSPAASSCRAVAAVEDSYHAAVYAELVFKDDEELASVFETLESVVMRCGERIERSIAGTEEKDLRDLKLFRHAVPERANAIIAERKLSVPGLHKIATDMAVPDSSLREVFALYRKELDALKLDYCIFGHAGNNHFHVNILPKNAEELALGKRAYLEFARRVVTLGGAVSAEHGIGRVKKEFLTVQYGSDVLQQLRIIKEFFDPTGLLNPGVLL